MSITETALARPANHHSKLPEGWRWARLGDVCNLVGESLNPQQRVSEMFAHYSIPAYDAGQVPTFEPGVMILSNKVLFPVGAVLFSKLNPRISRVWYVRDGHPYPRICSTEFLPLLPMAENVCPEFLIYILQESDLITGLRRRVAAATKSRERLKPEIVLDAEIPLPPMDEQKRIAAILNEQMGSVERGRAAAETQLAAAKALPAAYLRAVFSSPEAQQWPRKMLGEVALIVQNGIYKTADNYGHGDPFLRMYNIQNYSWTLTLERMALVALAEPERITFRLKSGDLLISRVNSYELVGKCAWVGPETEGYVFENMLIRIRLDQSADPLFVAQQFATRGVREQIESVAKRAIGQASINSEDVRGIRLLLPGLPDQQRIAAMLREQIVSAEQAHKAIEGELDAINKLPAALLRRAFDGEL